MALTPEALRSAGDVVQAAASLREAAATWRKRDPAMRVIVVDALDIRDETPVLRLGSRRIYLATSTGICLSITQQPEQATALVFAED